MQMINQNEFTAINSVTLCGKIVAKRYDSKSMELVVTISIEPGKKKKKKNEKGQFIRDLVTVRFFNIPAVAYDDKYKKGDFVQISGVAQDVKNVFYRNSHTEISGCEMNYRGRKNHDRNMVHIRGKIESSKVITENYILLNVATQTEESISNPSKDKEVEMFEQKYRSVTAIGIRCKKNAREIIKSYTPGTWVDCTGFVDVRTIVKNEKIRREMRIVSLKEYVVGQVQPYKG